MSQIIPATLTLDAHGCMHSPPPIMKPQSTHQADNALPQCAFSPGSEQGLGHSGNRPNAQNPRHWGHLDKVICGSQSRQAVLGIRKMPHPHRS